MKGPLLHRCGGLLLHQSVGWPGMHISLGPGARGGPTVQDKPSVQEEEQYYYYIPSLLLLLLQPRWPYCAGEGLFCVLEKSSRSPLGSCLYSWPPWPLLWAPWPLWALQDGKKLSSGKVFFKAFKYISFQIKEGVKKTFYLELCPKHRTPPTHRHLYFRTKS